MHSKVYCLETAAGIPRSRITLSLRVHDGVSVTDSKKFWSRITKISPERITRVEIVDGKKRSKLLHGMCRVRVSAGIRERLLVQALITSIGEYAAKRL